MLCSRLPLAWLLVVLNALQVQSVSAVEPPEHRYYDQGEIDLDQLRKARSISRQNGKPVVSEIRAEALKETALMVGSRAGLYVRMREINQILDQRAARYDQVFQFAPLMLAHQVQPPVIQVGYDNVRLHDGYAQTLRITDALYDIVRDARFAQTPPDWRTYLYLSAAKPEPPDESLMPDAGKSAEVALWEDSIERGLRAGVQQANRTFEVQLNRLVRDLTGMALYRELLAKEMVTPPRVSEEYLGITGSGKTMAVNDRILRIDVAAEFIRKNKKWKPYASKPSKRRVSDAKIAIRVHPEKPTPVAEEADDVVPPPIKKKRGVWDSR